MTELNLIFQKQLRRAQK